MTKLEENQRLKIIDNLRVVIAEAIKEDKFEKEAYEALPMPWLAKRTGLSVMDVRELNLQLTAKLIYSEAIEFA
jgi:hypothetical protein